MNRFLTLAALLFVGWTAPVFAADSLCPDIAQEKDNTPGDVAGVQADIERLNLCVERAKLLKQLDQIAQDRADVLAKVTGASSGNTMMSETGMIPALPASALPGLPPATVTPLAGDVKLTSNVKATLPTASPMDTPRDAGGSHWRVRKIWGQGAGMHAQVTDGNGTLLNVIKGDPLPDGQVVETVSVRGVATSQNGKVTDLSWDDTAPAGNTLNAAQAAP